MRDIIALLRTLVLPAGATTGKRIVLDGDAGKIQAFDANNNLVVDIDANGIEALNPNGSFVNIFGGGTAAVVNLQPADVGGFTFSSAALYALAQAVAGREITFLQLDSPAVDGNPRTSIIMASSDDLGNPGYIDLLPDLGGDLRYRGASLGRGKVGTPFDSAANDAARAAGVNTDMFVTFTADATRLYEVTVKAQLNFGTAAAIYALEAVEGGTVGANDGTAIDRFRRWSAAETPAGSLTGHASSSIQYRPTAGSKTVRVANDAGSGGTITLVGAAGPPPIRRQLWIKDIGPR